MEFYNIYHDEDGKLVYADDGDCDDVEYISELFDFPLAPERVDVDTDNCLVGYFYYNDMEDYTTADPYYFTCQEHMDVYYENHNGDGHYALDRIETIENGKMVSVEFVCDRESWA